MTSSIPDFFYTINLKRIKPLIDKIVIVTLCIFDIYNKALIKIRTLYSTLPLILLFFNSFLFAQEKGKEFLIPSISGEIKINGIGDEVEW